MKKKPAKKKVGAKKKSAATRIKPVNLKSGKKKLSGKDVEGQSWRDRFEVRCPWACAAVRG